MRRLIRLRELHTFLKGVWFPCIAEMIAGNRFQIDLILLRLEADLRKVARYAAILITIVVIAVVARYVLSSS